MASRVVGPFFFVGYIYIFSVDGYWPVVAVWKLLGAGWRFGNFYGEAASIMLLL